MRRRTFLKGVAATATAAFGGPLIVTDRTIAQARTVFVNTWGGSWTAAEEAAFFKPFTEATGIRVQTVAPVSYAKLKAQVQSGQLRVGRHRDQPVRLAPGRARRACRADRLDRRAEGQAVSRTPFSPTASPTARSAPICAIARISSRRAVRRPGPTSGTCKKFPGTARSTTTRAASLAFALLADGVPPDKLYPDGRRSRLQEARPDQAAHQSVVDAGEPVAAADPRRGDRHDGDVERARQRAGAAGRARRARLERRRRPHHDVGRREGRAAIASWPGSSSSSRSSRSRRPNSANRLYYGPTNPKASSSSPPRSRGRCRPIRENVKVRPLRADAEWEAAQQRHDPGALHAVAGGLSPAAAPATELGVRGRAPRTAAAWLLLGPACLLLVAALRGAARATCSSLSVTDPRCRWRTTSRIFTVPLYTQVMLNTFVTSLIVTVLCLVLGYPLAYVMARRDRLGVDAARWPSWP